MSLFVKYVCQGCNCNRISTAIEGKIMPLLIECKRGRCGGVMLSEQVTMDDVAKRVGLEAIRPTSEMMETADPILKKYYAGGGLNVKERNKFLYVNLVDIDPPEAPNANIRHQN